MKGAAGAFASGLVPACPLGLCQILVGEATKILIDNVLGDKPFNIKDVEKDLLSGLVGSFWPGRASGKLGSALNTLLGDIFGVVVDPTKSCKEKLQVSLIMLNIFLYIDS